MKNVIGVRKAEVALTSGHMFTSDEALNVGLVDEIVNDKEAGLVAAGKFLAVHSKIPGKEPNLKRYFYNPLGV